MLKLLSDQFNIQYAQKLDLYKCNLFLNTGSNAAKNEGHLSGEMNSELLSFLLVRSYYFK